MDGWTIETSNNERGFVVDEALRLALDHASTNGLTITWRTVGSEVKTTTAKICSSNGSSAIGRGKGLEIQSVASAVFESLEHYYHLTEDLTSHICGRFLDTEKLEQSLLDSSPDLKKIIGLRKVPLTCINFQSLISDGKSLCIPAILFNPKFSPADAAESSFIEGIGIFRYSTNSGTAAGLSVEEARLHGLLEIIERDAISIAFVRHVLSPIASPARVVDKSSLPMNSRELIKAVETESNGNIKIWEISTDVGIPVILCSLTTDKSATHRFFGSGASLSQTYALERAALEALQGHHIHTEFGVRLQPPVINRPSHSSLFQRCELRYGYFEYRGGEKTISWDEVEGYDANKKQMTIKLQLDQIISMLQRAGIECYTRTILSSDIFVVQVAAPKLERLFLISEGLSVGPGARARSFRQLN